MAASSVYLESLFDKSPKKAPPPAPPKAPPADSQLDDVSVWQVLASQTEYLQKLESANKRFQDESKFLRDNLRNLVEDNSRLYGELKGVLSNRIEELADKRAAVSAVVRQNKENAASDEGTGDDEEEGEAGEEEEEEESDDERQQQLREMAIVKQSRPSSGYDRGGSARVMVPTSSKSPSTSDRRLLANAAAGPNAPKQLSNLVRMHASRADRLESEVRALKTQLDSSRLIISELKASAQDSSAGSTAGSVQVDAESMLKLMNERDEAVGRIARLVERLNVCDQHRQALEGDLRDALKLVDEAVREKQIAVDDKMRLTERISEFEEKIEGERESADRRLEQAVKIIRGAASEQIKAAEDKMTLAMAESLRHEQKAARLAKDQRRLAAELEHVRLEAAKFEQELADANSDFKSTLARVLSDRDIALRELSRMRALTSQERGDLDTDRCRLAEQLRLARSQIADCQQELNSMAADRLQAVSQMNDALAQVENERRQRSEMESEVDAVRQELSAHAKSLKQQSEAAGGEMRRIVEQQADLIRRLRTECDRLLNGYSTEKSEADRLRAENALLLSRLRRSQEELGAARFDASASAQVQDALRWRMAELDSRAKQAKAEVEDILARSNGSQCLLREANSAAGAISVAVNKTLNALKDEDPLSLVESSDADDSLLNERVVTAAAVARLSPRHNTQSLQHELEKQQEQQEAAAQQLKLLIDGGVVDNDDRNASSASTDGLEGEEEDEDDDDEESSDDDDVDDDDDDDENDGNNTED